MDRWRPKRTQGQKEDGAEDQTRKKRAEHPKEHAEQPSDATPEARGKRGGGRAEEREGREEEEKPGGGRGAKAPERGTETTGAENRAEDTERRVDKSTEEPEAKSRETSAER